ncbi:MAG: CDP-alcohol phosphatidyltransferase [Bacteroidia bacterium]|nr:MAG: CDP-alcohol phosphatidyltransferase [Bacteroidia bacterium]
MVNPYRYEASVKSRVSDELINTYVLRPVAGVIVRLLYRTPVTPNQVTVASTAAGILAGLAYSGGTPEAVAGAGLLVTLKDVLDSADGQLARAKAQYSRRGRFLDSIGDFVADIAIFGGIGSGLYANTGNPLVWLWSFLAFAGITLRVSHHVFYQTSYLHLEGSYDLNRITEEIRSEDLREDPLTQRLQSLFQFMYGWQDRLMVRIDEACRSRRSDREFLQRWYSDRLALRLSGLVGFGTELFLLMVCSVFNRLDIYLILNVTVMNGVVLSALLYRRCHLLPRLNRD